jgi:hypothetical protein
MASVSRKIIKRAEKLRKAGGPRVVPQEYTPEADGAPAAARSPLARIPCRLRRRYVHKYRSAFASLACVRHPKRETLEASPE